MLQMPTTGSTLPQKDSCSGKKAPATNSVLRLQPEDAIRYITNSLWIFALVSLRTRANRKKNTIRVTIVIAEYTFIS